MPYENFIGALLTRKYRIRRFLRTENCGDVYEVQDLGGPSDIVEAKVYTMYGLPHKLYKYWMRGLKTLESKDAHFQTIHQRYRKILISILSKGAARKKSALGGCGRRNTVEYDLAFPPLHRISEKSVRDGNVWHSPSHRDEALVSERLSNHDGKIYDRMKKNLAVILHTYIEEIEKTSHDIKAQGQDWARKIPVGEIIKQIKSEARSAIPVRQRTPKQIEQRKLRQIRYRQKQKEKKLHSMPRIACL